MRRLEEGAGLNLQLEGDIVLEVADPFFVAREELAILVLAGG